MVSGGTRQSDYLITLPFDTTQNLLIVNVEISGKDYRFLFDTGASVCLSQRLVDEIKPKLVGKMNVTDSESGTDSLNVYILPEITLDGVTFNDIPAFHLRDSDFMECLEFDGIIGSNLLKDLAVRFSSAKRAITITDNPEKFNLREDISTEMQIIPEQNFPVIKTLLSDNLRGNIDLLFDSGMTGFYDLALRHFHLFKDNNIFTIRNIRQGMGSHSFTFFGRAPDTLMYRLRIPDVTIGNVDFKNLSITTTTNDNSRVGVSLLHYGDVTLDFKNKRFYYEPYIDKDRDLYERELPVSISTEDGKFIIGVIWDKKLEDKLSIGDRIISINDVNLEGFEKCYAFKARLDFSNKDSFVFKIEDKEGNIKDVVVDQDKQMNYVAEDQSDYLISLPYDLVGGRLIVTVDIGGKEYRFVVDTGSGTHLSQKVIEEIKPDVLETMTITDNESRTNTIYTYSLQEITLDGVTFNNLVAHKLDDSQLTECLGIDGVIGSDLLQNSVVRFSSSDKTIRIANTPGKFDLNKENSTEMILVSGNRIPMLKSFLTDKQNFSIDVLFSSAMPGLYEMTLNQFLDIRKHDIFSDSIITQGMGGLIGTPTGQVRDTDLYRLRIPDLSIANAHFKNVTINTVRKNDSQIGSYLFNYGDVTIDYKNRQFYFEPYPKKNPDHYEKEMSVDVILWENKFIIGAVWNKDLQDEITPGDQVLSIDGISLEGKPGCKEMLKDYDFKGKDSFIFRIRDKDGNVKEVTIEKE